MGDGRIAFWDDGWEIEGAATGGSISVPIGRKKLRFLGISNTGNESKKFRK